MEEAGLNFDTWYSAKLAELELLKGRNKKILSVSGQPAKKRIILTFKSGTKMIFDYNDILEAEDNALRRMEREFEHKMASEAAAAAERNAAMAISRTVHRNPLFRSKSVKTLKAILKARETRKRRKNEEATLKALSEEEKARVKKMQTTRRNLRRYMRAMRKEARAASAAGGAGAANNVSSSSSLSNAANTADMEGLRGMFGEMTVGEAQTEIDKLTNALRGLGLHG